jgi:REP-associated tyrosine transposase
MAMERKHPIAVNACVVPGLRLAQPGKARRSQPEEKPNTRRLQLPREIHTTACSFVTYNHPDFCYSSSMHKYAYWRTLPHIQKSNRPLFVTFSTHKRWYLPSAARDIVLRSCLVQNSKTAELHVAAIMPDHAHLILTPLVGADGWTFSLAEIMKQIKGASAHEINRLLQRKGPVWQDERFDHILRSNQSLAEKVDYICQNPLRAGLVKDGESYPWLWKGNIPLL